MKKFIPYLLIYATMFFVAFQAYNLIVGEPETWQVVTVSNADGIVSEYRGNMTISVDDKGYTLKSQENSVFISNRYFVTIDDTKTPNTLEDSYIKAYYNDNYYYDLENLKESEY